MTEIYSEFYQQVSDLITSSQERGSFMENYLLSMKNIIEKSEIPENNIDIQLLDNSISETIEKINKYHIDYRNNVFYFVRFLNNIIKQKYNDLNIFLKNNNIKVGNIFAEISNIVGYPIDNENIKDIS